MEDKEREKKLAKFILDLGFDYIVATALEEDYGIKIGDIQKRFKEGWTLQPPKKGNVYGR